MIVSRVRWARHVCAALAVAGLSAAAERPEETSFGVEIRELRGGEELTLAFPQRDVQARWTPLAARAEFPWTASQGRIVSSGAGAMPFFALVSQTDANRLTLVCSELVRPVETVAFLKYEDGAVFSVSVKMRDADTNHTCRVRLDWRDRPFSETVRDAANWLRAAETPRVIPPAAYEPQWNSWYAYQTGVTVADMAREGAAAAALGVKTLVYDMGWDRKGALHSTSFRECGDWIPDAETFPDLPVHIAAQHARGLKCLLWCGYPLMGERARNLPRFRASLLRDKPDHRGCYTLDPGKEDVRRFVGDTLARALTEWGADGFKIDFIQSFGANGAKSADVVRIQEEVRTRIAAAKPDALIEYMAPYGGLAFHRYCTHVRAGDCPGDSVRNRWQTVNLRLFCGALPVHADMLTWDDSETPETAALQIISVLHAALQFGRSLADLPPDHARMVAHWLRFAAEHRETLQKGAFRPHGYTSGYPLIEMETAAERIFTVHAPGHVVATGALDRPVHAVNGTGEGFVVLDLPEKAQVVAFDTFGARVGTWTHPAGFVRQPVPKGGRLVVENVHQLVALIQQEKR